jgi:hypothetical protein
MLLQVHVFAVSAWLGLVAGETVMELHARDVESRRLVSQIHRWIDILLEGPLVATILISGALLLARAWPAPPWLLVKVGAGLIALFANVVCIAWVQARARARNDATVLALTNKIAMTGYAVPFALAALLIGFIYGA